MDYPVSGGAPNVAAAVVPGALDGGGVFVPASASAPMPVVPKLTSGGHAVRQTAATGASYTALAAQACKQVTIANNSGTTIGVTVGGGGAELPVFDQSYYTFYGLSDASELSIRRADASNSQVVVAYRWEA